MANYIQLSRYFLDDKDIHDLVSGGGVSNRFLLEFLRRRGIFLPEPDKNWFREDLINEFSRQQFSWNDISEFNREITSADREEKVETCKLTGVVATVDIQALVMVCLNDGDLHAQARNCSDAREMVDSCLQKAKRTKWRPSASWRGS